MRGGSGRAETRGGSEPPAPSGSSSPGRGTAPARLASRAAAEAGGTAPAVLNAANEVAVAAFLEGRLGFLGIPRVIEAVLERQEHRPAGALAAVLEADRWAREMAEKMLAGPAMAGA